MKLQAFRRNFVSSTKKKIRKKKCFSIRKIFLITRERYSFYPRLANSAKIRKTYNHAFISHLPSRPANVSAAARWETLRMLGACFSLSDSFTPESFATRSTRARLQLREFPGRALLWQVVESRSSPVGKRQRVNHEITRVPLPLFSRSVNRGVASG